MLDATDGDRRLKGLLISAIKRVWHRHPTRISVMTDARVEIQELKKDGSPKARPSVFYKCDKCSKLGKAQRTKGPYPQVHVDHIEPVMPLDGTSITWDQFIKRLFCKRENLQALCAPCHDQKTQAENAERRQRRAKLSSDT